MNIEAKRLAYSIWHEILVHLRESTDADERYDDLLRLADDYCSSGIIDLAERNTLIDIATTAYTQSVE